MFNDRQPLDAEPIQKSNQSQATGPNQPLPTEIKPLPKLELVSGFNSIAPSVVLNRSPAIVSPQANGAFPWVRALTDLGAKINLTNKQSLSFRYFALNEVERNRDKEGVGAFGINRLILEHSKFPAGLIVEQLSSEQGRINGLQLGVYRGFSGAVIPAPKNLRPDYGWAYVTTGGARPGVIDNNNSRIAGFVVFLGKSLPKGLEGTLLVDFRKSLGGNSSSSVKQLHTEATLLFPKIKSLSNSNLESRPYLALLNNAGNKFADPLRVQGGLSVQFLRLPENIKSIFK